MTPEQLAEIEQRANAATKGPWVWEAPRSYPQSITNAQAILIAETYISPDAPADDTEFIAHARQDVPALLAEVKRLQAKQTGPEPDVFITEAVTRFILHCSRCNASFIDDYEFDDTIVYWTRDELIEAFPPDFSDFTDVQGWIRIGDRILCFSCWDVAGNDEDVRVEKPARAEVSQ